MTKARWAVLGILFLLVVGVQHFGLEIQAETRAEAPQKRLDGVRASDVLPTYIASLFFGAFRAVAVDVLWIELRQAKEEKRWYEVRQLTQFISYVQPRNPEVWSLLGWDSAYNIANGFTDPEQRWKWVKFGLEWLRKGVTVLPHEPYLKDQLAYALWQKPSWQEGTLDMDFLRRIEADPELQATLLPDGMKADHPMSAFEIAIPWLERAREELLTRDYELTQMGLYLYPDTVDGFARHCMILQGMYKWKQGRPEEAKAWFRRAQKQVEDMLARTPDSPPKPGFERKYRNQLSSIFNDWAKFYARYPEIVDLTTRAESGNLKDELALLALLQGLIVQYGPIDDQWFWMQNDPRCFLSSLKQKVTRYQDTQECNDSFEMASDLAPGDRAVANLAPAGLDVDFYALYVRPPRNLVPPPAHPPRPATLKLDFKRRPTAKFELKVTFFDGARHPLKEQVVGPSAELRVQVPEYGRYYLKVEAANPALPWPPDTSYQLQYSVEP